MSSVDTSLSFRPSDLRAFEAAFNRLEPATPRWSTPGELAKAIDAKTVQTPALDVIDEALVWAYSTPEARLIISMPPQEGKSQRVTKTGVLWALLQNPELRFGIVSYAQELAEGFAREIRDWITNNNGDEGSLDLGVRIQRDNGAARRWKLAGHKGGVNAVGIGSGLTGRPLDVLIVDDPFKDSEQADSLYFRDRVWNWWQSTGSTRLAPGAPVIVILTRWHEDDLAGRLVAAEDGKQWRVINIPALADQKPEQADPLGRTVGEWLQSARRRTVAEWEAIRVRVGSRVFNALYQGRPSPETGDVWKRGWWRRYSTPLWKDAGDGKSYRLIETDEALISCDFTFKNTKASDFVVMSVWARKDADVFLVDQIRKRMSFTESVTALSNLVKKWPDATVKLVEDKANGTAVMDTLKSKIPGIIPVEPRGSKYARASAVAPFIEAGNVHLPATDIALFEVEDFIEEAAGFPNAAHDDQVDAASQAFDRLFIDGTGATAWAKALRARVAKEVEQITPDAPIEDPLEAARQAQFRQNH
jgi:predicted phage terminase large subunit-like protein